MRSPPLVPVVLASFALGLATARAEEPAPAPSPAADAPAAAPAEQKADTSEQAPAAPPTDASAPAATTEASKEKGAASPVDAPAPSPASAPEQPSPAEKPAEQAEKPAEKPAEQVSATPVEKPVEKPAEKPAEPPPVVRLRAVTASPEPASAPKSEPAQKAEPTDEPKDEKAADASTPANEVGLQIGWNAPAGTGGYYLRHLEGTAWSLGAGLAPLTLWGPKVSIIARHAEHAERGLFFQGSLGFSWGSDEVKVPVLNGNGSTQTATFKNTPGRTLDLVAGYRWPLGSTYFEMLGGYAFNIQGTSLQTGAEKVQIDDITRSTLHIMAPGGVVVAISYGLLF